MKHLKLPFASLVALLAVACEQVAIETIQPEQKMVEVAFEATADETRVALDGNIATWEVGDRISVALNSGFNSMSYAEMEIRSAGDISADGKKATFRGSIPTGSYYGVTSLYPAQSINFNETTLDRSAVKNIYMRSVISSNDTPVFTASEGESVVVPISFSHLMHKMDFAITSENNDLNTNNIAVEISATSDGSSIAFTEKQTCNLRSNLISVAESANSILAYGTSANFSTMLFPLGTTTNVEFTFGIYIDGEKKYEVKKGPFSTFTMSAGKTTKVNLQLSDDNSVTDGGEITAEPITLSASKSTIKANGVDSATLSVTTESGEDVTAQSTIYINGAVLNGTTFLTTSAGSYTLYAERLGVRSNELTISAEEVTSTGTTIVFADGVTLTSGWYDVNKFKQGDNGDIQMCWAASASNIIQWWQDRYVAMGGTLPASAVTGASTKTYDTGCKYQLALMDLFHEQWDNMFGGFVFHAIPWYFEGKNVCNGWSSQAQPLAGNNGGYFTSAEFTYNDYVDFGYTSDINGYGYWGNGTSLEGVDRLKKFSDIVVEVMDRGMASLTISLAENIMSLHHATTLWGYEIDNATGLLTRIWLTDSDDMTTEPKTQILHEFTVSIGDGKSHVKLSCDSIRYKNVWVVGIIPVSGPQM